MTQPHGSSHESAPVPKLPRLGQAPDRIRNHHDSPAVGDVPKLQRNRARVGRRITNPAGLRANRAGNELGGDNLMLPWGVVEWALRLVCLLIEGTPIEQRQATALQWFWMWWPVTKGLLKPEQQKQIEDVMQGVGK